MSSFTEQTNVTVAVFPGHEDAERAVIELQRAGFDMTRLSIVGAEYHTEEHVVGYYNTGDRMKAWGRAGAFWGGIWGVLFGAAFLVVPGLSFSPVPRNSNSRSACSALSGGNRAEDVRTGDTHSASGCTCHCTRVVGGGISRAAQDLLDWSWGIKEG